MLGGNWREDDDGSRFVRGFVTALPIVIVIWVVVALLLFWGFRLLFAAPAAA